MQAEGKWNRGTRDCCMVCGTDRGTVEDDGNWNEVESKTAAKKRKASETKDAALVKEVSALKVELAEAKAGGATAEEKAERAEAEKGRWENEAAAKLKGPVLTALAIRTKKVLKLESIYVAPSAAEHVHKSAQETVDAGCKSQDETSVLQEKVDKAVKERESLPDDFSCMAEVDARVKVLKSQLEAKLKSIRATGNTSVEILKTKQQRHRLDETARLEAAAKQTGLWQDQFDLMKDAVTRERDLIDCQLAEMEKQEKTIMLKWSTAEAARIRLAVEVDEAWTVKITACAARVADLAAGASTVQGAQADGVAAAGSVSNASASTAVAPVPVPAPVAVMPPQLIQTIPDTHLMSFVGQEDVPALTNLTEEEKGFLNHVDGKTQEWLDEGQIAIRYGHLLPAGADAAGVAAIRRLVGEVYWKSIYQDRTINGDDLVPIQMQWVLPRALKKAAADLNSEGDEGKKAVAAARGKGKVIMKAIGKRRKVAKVGDKNVEEPPQMDETL